MRLPPALISLAILATLLASLASLSVYASTSPLWYLKIVGDKDDEWSKAALLTIGDNHLYLYIVGNKWRQPIVVKLDVTSGRVSWALAIGNRSAGDLGDWPEFRDIALCKGKVFVAGFTSKNGAQALVAAIDASSGRVLWIRSYGANKGELKGLGIAVDPKCESVFVVGYAKNELNAQVRDAVILKINASTGDLIKAIRVDFGGSDYFIDDVYANGTLYAVGMTDAFDTPGKSYDIIVAMLNASSLSIEKVVDIGNKGVYEVAAISNYKNSGGAIAYDGHRIYVLGQMKDPKKGKTSTLVLALEPRTLSLLWSVRIRNSTDIDVEFYPDQIAVGSKLLYVAGHSWFYPGLWKEGGFVAILSKSDGSPIAFYIVHDAELRSGMGTHGIAVAEAGGIDYIATVSDYYLSVPRIAIEDKLSQVEVSKYSVSERNVQYKLYDVTKDVPSHAVSTIVSKLSFDSPANGKSNQLVLVFVEPGRAISVTKTITRTLIATQTITLTRTVVIATTVTSTKTHVTTLISTLTKTTTVPTTIYRTTTLTKTTLTTVTKSFTTTRTATITATTTLMKTITKAVEIVPAWVWGIAIALFIVGLGIGMLVKRRA